MDVQDVILTIALMLAAGLACRLLADLARLPHMLLLLVAGICLGPAGLDAIDVPLDSMGAQLVLTLGVSFILFHGGLQLSVRVLSKVVVGLGMLAVPGVVLTAVVTGAAAALAFDPAHDRTSDARVRGRRPERKGLADRSPLGVRRRPRRLDRHRRRLRRRPLGHDLEPPGGHLARVGSRRRDDGRGQRLLLDRLGRRGAATWGRSSPV